VERAIDMRSIPSRLEQMNKAFIAWEEGCKEFCKFEVIPKMRECKWFANQNRKGNQGLRNKVAFKKAHSGGDRDWIEKAR
jgi:hypothetical protein